MLPAPMMPTRSGRPAALAGRRFPRRSSGDRPPLPGHRVRGSVDVVETRPRSEDLGRHAVLGLVQGRGPHPDVPQRRDRIGDGPVDAVGMMARTRASRRSWMNSFQTVTLTRPMPSRDLSRVGRGLRQAYPASAAKGLRRPAIVARPRSETAQEVGMTVRIGVIGTGLMGGIHARAAQDAPGSPRWSRWVAARVRRRSVLAWACRSSRTEPRSSPARTCRRGGHRHAPHQSPARWWRPPPRPAGTCCWRSRWAYRSRTATG